MGQQKVYLKKYLILSQKVLAIHVYKTNGSYYYLNAKRPSLRHITLKLSMVNDKEF